MQISNDEQATVLHGLRKVGEVGMTGNEIIKWIKDNGLERINMFRPGRKLIVMNAKQALKAASKHIEDLEDFNRRSVSEVKYLNKVIDSVIAGEKTYCDWCQEQEECEREQGAGCDNWWLKMNLPVLPEEGEANDSKGILSASPES